MQNDDINKLMNSQKSFFAKIGIGVLFIFVFILLFLSTKIYYTTEFKTPLNYYTDNNEYITFYFEIPNEYIPDKYLSCTIYTNYPCQTKIIEGLFLVESKNINFSTSRVTFSIPAKDIYLEDNNKSTSYDIGILIKNTLFEYLSKNITR